ncbi:hypothetical protein F2Q68_00037776 [Brassica cretica]|uniref:GH10 domain-containing protein n=1 Tax=Brassica cretica TaxID=69181 RepID=A0A8S9H394_BRACR|nr:hypothetical protein F2Q68_00037776 [Brassica cretica]
MEDRNVEIGSIGIISGCRESDQKVSHLKAVNSAGEPVPNATISIVQNRLGFSFGCEVEKNILGNQAYQNWFTKRFTVTTFANEMKWYSTEAVRGKEDYTTADAMLRFFKQHALDTLAATGLPIWLTEVDVQAPPNVQANYFEQVLREGHAHPQVKGMVTRSGYSPSGCYKMCLTDGNFRNLPAGDVVDKLLREWGGLRVQTTGLTDSDGFFEASLFHGDYDINIAHPLINSTASHSFTLTSDDSPPSPFVVHV